MQFLHAVNIVRHRHIAKPIGNFVREVNISDREVSESQKEIGQQYLISFLFNQIRNIVELSFTQLSNKYQSLTLSNTKHLNSFKRL